MHLAFNTLLKKKKKLCTANHPHENRKLRYFFVTAINLVPPPSYTKW